MVENTEESGSTTTWKDLDFTLGTMEEHSKGSIKMTKSMAMESTDGTMVESTKATGSLASNMVLANM